MLDVVREGLVKHRSAKLVDELLAAHADAKKNFFLGGLRLSAVEGGRFCEAAFRMLEEHVTGSFTPIGAQLNTEGLISSLAKLPSGKHPDSVRLHIPRALRIVYDIRNKRDAAHLADGIDPNVQDATFVAGTIDWVLAEFVRLYHNVEAKDAQRIVEAIVTRHAPVVEAFGDFLKVLNPKLSASEYQLVLLYHCGAAGATYEELEAWSKPTMRSNLRRTLRTLVDDKALVHEQRGRFFITRTGIRDVESRNLFDVA